ncbi:MAG TPA: NTP transferase domain-containing protein [Firmicutes bacterium]|nr:NTP transferase domain-containing protein [Bacillota bacterium]
MQAVIMAGGKGTRLRPLTCKLPKPMVRIVNRPIMEHIVRLLAGSGFDDVIVTLCYMPELIQDYFGSGTQFGVKMRYSVEETALGTAGSVKNVESQLSGTFLVISGDALTDIDLMAAVEFHRSRGAIATIVLTRVQNPLEYGLVITDADGRIRRFLEKPGWGEVFSDTVNTGIYVLEPEVLSYFEAGREFDFSKNLFPLLLEAKTPLFGYVAPGYWCDVGTLEQYRQTHYDILMSRARVGIAEQEAEKGIWIGDNVYLDPSARITAPCVIGRGSVVEKDAEVGELSVIGPDTMLCQGASVRRSIVQAGGYIGKGAALRGAILGDHVVVKPEAELLEGSVVGPGCSIGEKALVKQGVRVWPEKVVEDGTILSGSLVWGSHSSKRLFGTHGVSGILNAEITPEVAAKLGAAFGSVLPQGRDGERAVAVASDVYSPSRMLKRAVTAGLLSCGVDIFDLGHITTSVTRYAVSALGAQGGVHVRVSPYGPDAVLLEFLDPAGINISRDLERKVENAFFNDDFQRSPATQPGEVAFLTRVADQYLEGLLRQVNVDAVRARRFCIAVDYDPGSLSLFLPSLFDRLGCEVVMGNIATSEAGSPKGPAEVLEALAGISRLVRASKADLGIVVDNNAERLLLVDELGREIGEDSFLALMSLLTFKSSSAAKVAVPVTAPGVIEAMARAYRGQVIRTKANPRSIMEKAIEQKIFSGEKGLPRFQPAFDALIAFTKILEFLAEQRISLSTLVGMIPEFYMKKGSVDCPWEAKGKVIRTLIETTDPGRVELIDGVKVYHDEGWALVLPDSDGPRLHIVSEAATPEQALALQRMYMTKIENIRLEQ